MLAFYSPSLWKFHRPSMGVVWVFSGITHLIEAESHLHMGGTNISGAETSLMIGVYSYTHF